MSRRVATLLAMIAAAIAIGAGPGTPVELESSFVSVLTTDLKFTSDELNDLVRGRLVAHALPAGDPREIAVVGAVRVNTAASALVDRVRDITRFKQSPDILQIGTFSSPPDEGDLASLVVTPQDADLRDCRVGNCDVRLSADAIARVQRVDWRAPDARARAVAVFKHILFNTVRAYVSGSGDRMTEYVDGRDPIRPVDDFRGVLKNSPTLGRLVPGLPAHLADFPSGPADAIEDFLYWSKEKFGLAPFITVTHVSIARAASGAYVITSKDVYSSRYLDASLGMTIASGVPGTHDRFYMVYVTRSRAHALGGFFSGVRRSIAERRAKTALEQNLKTTRSKVERGL